MSGSFPSPDREQRFINMGFMVINADNEIVYSNKKADLLFECNVVEKTSYKELFDEKSLKCVDSVMLFSDNRKEETITIKKHPYIIRGFYYSSSEKLYFALFIIDGEKESERANFQKIMNRIVDKSVVAMAILDKNYNVLYINNFFTLVYGYTLDEIEDQTIDKFLDSGNKSIFQKRVEFAEKEGYWRGEDKRVRKDKSSFPASSSLSIIYDEEQNFLCYLDVSRDITDRQIEIEQLKKMSFIDPLTELMNRRQFKIVLNMEWCKAMTQRFPISVIMIDIDLFKNYNDHFGHPAGDECLKEVSFGLSEVLRKSDTISRYGGEEFIVLLPGIADKDAAKVAEKLRKAVEALEIKHAKSDVSKHVTISLGVSSVIPERGIDPLSLISLADDALYDAKGSGRNCVKIRPFSKELLQCTNK